MKGIDVSENNGRVDWKEVAAAGYKFAIIRCSYGQHEWDEYFAVNVKGAHDAGLLVGAYHYGYGLSVEDAKREAENCMAAIEYAGVELELPVFYDMEDADNYKDKHGFNFDPYEIYTGDWKRPHRYPCNPAGRQPPPGIPPSQGQYAARRC